jgi:uncharacterized protein (TIGR03905 family)
MSYIYKTKGTCSTQIELELEGDVVHNVKFTGGCNGNLQAIPKLVEGLTVAQVEEKIGGIAHFAGEEGPERHNFYQYNSYGDWFESLYQNGEWDTYDDDNWPDVSESSAQWQDYETGV